MPKVTEEHRAARKRQIVQAALRRFAKTGFAATSMADIIEESGLSAGAIYGHYKSKDELIEIAVTELLDARFLELAQERATGQVPSPGDILRTVIGGLTAQIGELQLLLQIWGQVPVNPELGGVARTIGHRARDLFTSHLTAWYAHTRGLNDDDAAALARRFAPLYVGMLQGYVTQTVLFDDFDGEAYLEAAGAVEPA